MIWAALGAYFIGSSRAARARFTGAALDAPFASYREIARDKLASWLPTWPFQYPLSWMIPDVYSPIRNVRDVAPVPALFICSETDDIVPRSHTLRLVAAAKHPKTLWVTRGPHIATFADPQHRTNLLRFFEHAVVTPRPAGSPPPARGQPQPFHD